MPVCSQYLTNGEERIRELILNHGGERSPAAISDGPDFACAASTVVVGTVVAYKQKLTMLMNTEHRREHRLRTQFTFHRYLRIGGSLQLTGCGVLVRELLEQILEPKWLRTHTNTHKHA